MKNKYKLAAVGLAVFAVVFAIGFVIMQRIVFAPQPDFEGHMMFYENHNILKVCTRPLFNASGGINEDVLEKLMQIIDSRELTPFMRTRKKYWPSGMVYADAPFTYVTAQDFSRFVVPDAECMDTSGAIVIQLFEMIPDKYGVEHGHLTEFTSQWWQLVYRSADDNDDVLTLWMMQPYRLSAFGGSRYDTLLGRTDESFISTREDGALYWFPFPEYNTNTIHSDHCIANGLPPSDRFFFENNYSASIVRANLLRDLEHLLAQFDVEHFLVAPKNVPGNWQSSRTQTGTNMLGQFYASGHFTVYRQDYPGSTRANGGLGAVGRIWSHTRPHFNIINGKDGLSIGPMYNHWPHTNLVPTHGDLLWLPSDFEIRSLGHDKDDAMFQTFLIDAGDPATTLRWNYTGARQEDSRYGSTLHGRSGLWRLNGFDRAFDSTVMGEPGSWEAMLNWVRSVDTLGMGTANMVCHVGNRYGWGIHQPAGVRPALHLSVHQLQKQR